MITKPAVEYLYYFSNDDFYLVETKRKDLPPNSPPESVYKWLGYSRSSNNLFELTFEGMENSDQGGRRRFSEGDLVFTADQGRLSYQNTELSLDRLPPSEVPEELARTITANFKKQSASLYGL